MTPVFEFAVHYSDHDRGSPGGRFIRKTSEDARRSADLMRQCGYRYTAVCPFLMNPLECADLSTEELTAAADAAMCGGCG